VGDLFISIFTHLLFGILLFMLEKYKRDFQMFITTIMKPIMEYLHLKIFILMLEE
jgi:hypothetical protein